VAGDVALECHSFLAGHFSLEISQLPHIVANLLLLGRGDAIDIAHSGQSFFIALRSEGPNVEWLELLSGAFDTVLTITSVLKWQLSIKTRSCDSSKEIEFIVMHFYNLQSLAISSLSFPDDDGPLSPAADSSQRRLTLDIPF
jgi:hypothetical protein